MRVTAAVGLVALTGLVSARPHAHNHHHANQERELVVNVVTEYDYVTVTDQVAPPPAPTTSSTSTTSVEPTSSAAPVLNQENAQIASSPSPSSSSSSTTQAPVVVPTPSSTATPTWMTTVSYPPTSTSDTIETATATGGAGVKIYNNLDQVVYLWATSNTAGDMEVIEKGESYTESWQINPDGGGVSIKLATTKDELSVLQFEYTKEDETIWWDMSSINLDKTSEFVQNGFSVTSNDASCSTVTCDAGDADCSESYQHPNDIDTRSCSSKAAFTLKLGV